MESKPLPGCTTGMLGVPKVVQQLATLVLSMADDARYPENRFFVAMCAVIRGMCQGHPELQADFGARLELAMKDPNDPHAIGIMTLLGALGSKCSENPVLLQELFGLMVEAKKKLDLEAERDLAEGLKTLHPSIPRIPPDGWEISRLWGMGVHYVKPLLREPGNFLQCILTVDELDRPGSNDLKDHWLHLSISTPRRMPSWEELVKVKESFIGVEKKAVIVVPERSKHVNNHPYCMHLWHCLEGVQLPDFTALV